MLEPQLLVTALKAIKHLSTSPELIDVLQNSNAIEVLVRLLGQNNKGPHSNVRDLCAESLTAGHLFAYIPDDL